MSAMESPVLSASLESSVLFNPLMLGAELRPAWARLTRDIPVAYLVKQELVQKLEFIGISDLTEH